MRNDDDLDLLIDAALTTYADPGPDFARRVLNRVAMEPARAPRRRWLFPAIALPAAACLLLLVLVHPRPRTIAPRLGQAHAAAPLQKPEVLTSRTGPLPVSRREMARPVKAAAQNRPSVALVADAQPLPKLDVFPTPEPPSPQERALAVLAARTPQPELRALAKSQEQEVPSTVASLPVLQEVSLTVASLHVMPLEWPDEGKN